MYAWLHAGFDFIVEFQAVHRFQFRSKRTGKSFLSLPFIHFPEAHFAARKVTPILLWGCN
jgi:hypothetical protein